MAISIHEFIDYFNDEYEFLYDHSDNVPGYREAVNAFDEFVKGHGDFVGEFAKFRGDFVSSDREAAAFMFALHDVLSDLEDANKGQHVPA